MLKEVDKILIGWSKGLRGQILMMMFGNVDDGPSTHDGISGRAVAPHRPSEGDNVNAASHRPSEGDTINAAPHKTAPANNDPPLEEGEWIDPPLEDDMESLVDSNDD